MTLAEVADVVGGEPTGDPHVRITGPASVDSRDVATGGLFVAVPGEHVDGHAYAEAAVGAGAAAYLGSRETAVPGVLVGDPVAALGRLARHVLDTVRPTVLALTGSQGKTGTKDFLAHLLQAAGPTVATLGNHNNEIGVPLTVLRVEPDTRFVVAEMGARGIGHVAYLCEVAPPVVSAVLNVGSAHIGEFGSREAIAQAKGEIVEALPPTGTAVLNAGDPLVAAMASRTAARVLTFGEAGDVAFAGIEPDDFGRPSFDLSHAGATRRVRLTQSGGHQVHNAAAAAAMALATGVPFEDVCERLGSAGPASRWRMELHERADGLVVVNDAYNANPDSMVAALDTLGGIGRRTGRRTVAVLGVMLELGEEAEEGHRRVGAFAADAGIDVVVVVGEAAAGIARGARSGKGTVHLTAGRDDALAWVRENVATDDVVLVKASRGAALEHIADALLEDATP